VLTAFTVVFLLKLRVNDYHRSLFTRAPSHHHFQLPLELSNP
jgi:hypothetical protein